MAKVKVSELLRKSGLLLIGVPFAVAIFYSAGYALLIGLGLAHAPKGGETPLKNFLEQFAAHLIVVGMFCMIVGGFVGHEKVSSKSK